MHVIGIREQEKKQKKKKLWHLCIISRGLLCACHLLVRDQLPMACLSVTACGVAAQTGISKPASRLQALAYKQPPLHLHESSNSERVGLPLSAFLVFVYLALSCRWPRETSAFTCAHLSIASQHHRKTHSLLLST